MATLNNYELLSAASATGSGKQILRGVYQWSIWGTWGGGTATLQWSPDGGTTWFKPNWLPDDSQVVATADHAGFIPLADGHVRVLITGATGASLSSKLGGLE